MWEVIHEIFIALAIVGFVAVIIGAVLHFGGWDWRVTKIGVAIMGVGLFGVVASDQVSISKAIYGDSFFFVTEEGISIMEVLPETLFFLGVVGTLMAGFSLVLGNERGDRRVAKIGGAIAVVSFVLSIFVVGDWLSIRESLPEILFLLGVAGIMIAGYDLMTVKERGDWRNVKIGGAIAGVSFVLAMFAPAIGPASPFETSSQQATAANETDMDRCQWKWGATVISGLTSDILPDRGIIENVSVQDYGDAFRLEVGISETVGGAPQLATYSADLDRSSCARITEFEIVSRQDLPNGR